MATDQLSSEVPPVLPDKQPRVAIVHDWLTNLGGAEREVLAIKQAFPQADIYSSVYNRASLPQFHDLGVRTSFLQYWPLAQRRHQLYPLLRQLAFENFDWHDYDVVISSSSAEAKGIVTPTEVLHVGIIYTPTRYYWVDYEGYQANPGFGPLNPLVKLIVPRLIRRLKRWDYAAAQRPDTLISISQTVSDRVQKHYDRASAVIYPPVDVSRFTSQDRQAAKADSTNDYFLVVSRLVPYKKIDLVVRVFIASGDRLIIAGNGSDLKKLQALAESADNIEFRTDLDDAAVTNLFLDCRAFIFPTEEDFGIAPVEAMAAGKPVIAYGRGGAAETVVDGQTGVIFGQQTPEALESALRRFKRMQFDAAAIRHHAERFSQDRFVCELQGFVAEQLKSNQKPRK